MDKVKILEMTSDEFQRAIDEQGKNQSIAIIPVASTEELGQHGPLGADVFVADHVSELVGRKCNCIVSPVIPVGEAGDMMSWPGTLSSRSNILKEYYLDICRSYIHHGIRRIFFFTAHLGNLRSVEYCGKLLRKEGVLVSQVDWWRAAARAAEGLMEDTTAPTGHGGELITSVLLAIKPGLVHLDRTENVEASAALQRHLPHTAISGGPYYTYPSFEDFTSSGAWGDLSYVSADKGRRIIERSVVSIADFIGKFRAEPLPAPTNSTWL